MVSGQTIIVWSVDGLVDILARMQLGYYNEEPKDDLA